MLNRLLVLLLLAFCWPQGASANLDIEWTELPPVPAELGLGGPQAGVHNGALIVVGGANFPQGFPWEGGPKTWHDTIYVLPDYKNPGSTWREAGAFPFPIGHGTSHSTADGFIIVGGGDGESHTTKVHRLRWDGTTVLVDDDLPELPFPLAFHGSVMIGTKIYVSGGISAPADTEARRELLSLDLSAATSSTRGSGEAARTRSSDSSPSTSADEAQGTALDAGGVEAPLVVETVTPQPPTSPSAARRWQNLGMLPGEGRIMPVIAALQGQVFVAGGASLYANEEGRPARRYLIDGYRYDPSKEKEDERWKQIADMPRKSVAAPSPAPQVGPTHFIVLGGDNGEGLPPEVALEDHAGFARDILAYHAITDTWAKQGELPFGHVTGPVITIGDEFIIPTGEIRPGVRSPVVHVGKLLPHRVDFGTVNYSVLFLYLIGVTFVGLLVTGLNRNTNDFYRGAGTIPWWAAGLSIFATMSSSIGYLAITAKSYSEDWIFLLTSLPILLLAPIIIRFYLPFFRHVDSDSAYEFLERRFSLLIRLFGSFSFVLFHMGRMAVVLYLPALAIATVTPLTEFWCILLMGGLCIIYCAAGGIRAVVFTDSLQSVILLGALIVSLIFAFSQIDGGIGGFISIASEDNKFRMVNFSLSPLIPALWVVILGNLFANLLPYTADQAVVQRYMTTKDEKTAAMSIWTNAILAMPNTLLMFLLGTALYVFYKSFPERLSPGINTDAIFPLFIANELPIGLAGLAVAGILAAAQSTVSTSINSVSTVLMVDVVGRLGLTKKGATDLTLARTLSVAAGLIGTGLALYVSSLDTRSLWDLYMKIMGLTGSSLAGLFVLGIFTTRTNAFGAAVGAFTSIIALWFVQNYTPLHFFLYAAVGVCVTVFVGYTVSLMIPSDEGKDLKGLTLHTIEKK